MHACNLEAAFQNWLGYFSVIKGPRLVLVIQSSQVYHKEHVVQDGFSNSNCPGDLLDRKEEELWEGHTLLLKETSRQFFTTHLAILNLREAGKCSSSSEHIVFPSIGLCVTVEEGAIHAWVGS